MNDSGQANVPGKVTSAVLGGNAASSLCGSTSPTPTVQADGQPPLPASPLPDTAGGRVQSVDLATVAKDIFHLKRLCLTLFRRMETDKEFCAKVNEMLGKMPADPIPGVITKEALAESLRILPEVEAKRIERENKLFKRLLPPLVISNNELDRATPPQGWSTWEKFINGEPRDLVDEPAPERKMNQQEPVCRDDYSTE